MKFMLFTLLLSYCLNLNAQQTGQFSKTFTDRGIISTIYYNVPMDIDPNAKHPLLIAWHGAGDNGNNMRYIINTILGSKINAIVVCPDANKINGKDSSYFYNLLRESYYFVLQNYKIELDKKIIMGFSWGGGFAYQNGLNFPELFNGIIGHAPAIGNLSTDQWNNISKIRMATILGDKDFNWTAVNNLMNSITSKGANLLYIVKPGVQHVDNVYFNSQDIIDDYKKCYDYVIQKPTDVVESNENEYFRNMILFNNQINIEDIGEIELYNNNLQYIKRISFPYFLDFLPSGIYFLLPKDKKIIKLLLIN